MITCNTTYAYKLTEQDTLCFALAEDGLKYSQQGFGQLLFQVVLSVDGNVVLQHVDRVLKATRGGINPSVIVGITNVF